MVVNKDQQVLQFIGREDVNQYVVISYTMLVSEKAELEIEVSRTCDQIIFQMIVRILHSPPNLSLCLRFKFL